MSILTGSLVDIKSPTPYELFMQGHHEELEYFEDSVLAVPPASTPVPPFELVHGDLDSEIVWIIAGVAQAQAAAVCQPDDLAIYCVDQRNFFNAVRPDGLDAIEDKSVLIFPLGDAASDHYVFDRATAFGRICDDEGASDVQFVWLGTDLDAHLGGRDLDQRRKRLASAVKRRGKKPAKARPKAPSLAQQDRETKIAELQMTALEEGRPVIDVNDDRLVVLNKLVHALTTGRDRDRIFNLGGKLACTTTDEKTAVIAELVDEERLLNLLSRNAQMISVTTKGVNAAWPESKTLTAMFGRHRDFRPLRGVAPSPIVRADNTIADQDGYDEASQLLLDLGGLKLEIPDDPSEDDISEAVRLLLEEWLGDFPFASQADKANVLGLVLTYPLRELVDLIPLAVISAKSPGTGKSKLLALIVLLFTNVMPEWDSLPATEEETRKQITTLLSTASPFLGFDESPVIGGKSINRLLTARTWSDRLLGGNQRASLPNRSVMAATGNNVQVLGDTRRRYFPIELFYDGEDPENRPESDFRHADVEAWTEEHRGELLTAVFTLVRAWQVAGRPKRATSFGSFERWEAVVGGVVETSGVDGFLENLSEHRASADYDAGLWTAHCEWLASTFPSGEFTVREVVKALTRLSGSVRVVEPSAELPPEVEGSPLDAGYPAKLGRLYNARRDGWSGGYRIGKTNRKTHNQVTWSIEVAPRILRAQVAAAAEAKALGRAEREIAQKEQAANDRPVLRTACEESVEAKLARLKAENAHLIAARP